MEDVLEEPQIREHAAIGARRCVNEKRAGTCVMWPESLSYEEGLMLHDKQRAVFTRAAMRDSQIYLLKRASELLDFVDGNLGGNDDFPLVLLAESPEASDAFNDHLDNLRESVEVLTTV